MFSYLDRFQDFAKDVISYAWPTRAYIQYVFVYSDWILFIDYVCVGGDGGLSICSTCHSSALCRSGSIILLCLSRIAGLDN